MSREERRMMDIPKIEAPALRADATTQGSTPPASKHGCVLIVDDTPSKLMALSAIVSGMALEVVTANSGEQALRQLLKQDFAVILLDVNMPTMSGFETATLIRSRPRSAYTPIIFVTAEADSEADRISGYALGAVDFIYSPIIPEVLRAKVQVFVDLFNLQGQILLHNEQLESLVALRTSALTEEVTKNKEMVVQLIAQDKVKNELIQNVNHELRTPLTAIIGYVDMMIDDVDSDVEPELAASLATVLRNSLRLQLFIESMMQVSKIEFGEVPLVISTIDIGNLLGDVETTLKSTANNFGVEVTLRLDSPASDLLIDGDVHQLEQVFLNLVNNALKFTPRGGKVTIVARHAHVDGGYVEVKVTDTGIGIPAEEFPNVFERLFRASTALDADIPGFGIGLSLVRLIVLQHQGTITFDSTVGKWTVFTVTLPIRYLSTSSPVETT